MAKEVMAKDMLTYLPQLTETKRLVSVFGVETTAKKLGIHPITVERRLKRLKAYQQAICPPCEETEEEQEEMEHERQ